MRRFGCAALEPRWTAESVAGRVATRGLLGKSALGPAKGTTSRAIRRLGLTTASCTAAAATRLATARAAAGGNAHLRRDEHPLVVFAVTIVETQ